jgi:S-adenosylmethionine hydrolase
MAGINPQARLITISHDVAPGDIIGGWYLLKTHYRYFPPGTVHMAVIDPGVGTSRKIITIETEKYVFVAPDNGLLSFIPADEILSMHAVSNREYALSQISPVFHGRDIIAPAAAYLSLGIDPSCLGRACVELVGLRETTPLRDDGKIRGQIIWVDRFGNLVTNIVGGILTDKDKIVVNGERLGNPCRTFADVDRGQPLAYIGSGGHLEIAVREGSAAEYFKHRQHPVEIEVAPESKET